MLQEKPNTARLMVFHQSRALSYAIALNYRNGVVTGDK